MCSGVVPQQPPTRDAPFSMHRRMMPVNMGGRMSKIKRATRDQLCRRGNFWTEGMTLTEKDLEMLQSLKKRADELGYTPLVRDVPDAGKIKGCFRCWKDAIKATGLPSEREPEQVKKRMAARQKHK